MSKIERDKEFFKREIKFLKRFVRTDSSVDLRVDIFGNDCTDQMLTLEHAKNFILFNISENSETPENFEIDRVTLYASAREILNLYKKVSTRNSAR